MEIAAVMQIAEFTMKAMAMLPDLINAAGSITEAFTAASAHVGKTQDMVKAMQAEGRGPTPDEWAYLDATSAALHKAVQAE